MRALTLVVLLSACRDTTPPKLEGAQIFVSGQDSEENCREKICRHNENVDMTVFKGAVYMVHRTAKSQILGPNSALHVYRRDTAGAFQEVAIIPAINDRDLRDPSLYVAGGQLMLKALTRLPVVSARDSNVQTISVLFRSDDGEHWSGGEAIGPETFSFWRVKDHGGKFYNAAYEDGDKQVVLFSSADGVAWERGATIYDQEVMTPLETELTFMPSGRLLALVRTDGHDLSEWLGDGHLETQVCWADPPAYDHFSCPQTLLSERLDGPVTFFHGERLFVLARTHISDERKRTTLFEITGKLEGGPIALKEWLTLPSAGDTAYAGVAPLDDHRFTIAWYSSDLTADPAWLLGMLGPTDIWTATLSF
jgi:hypothetical protein